MLPSVTMSSKNQITLPVEIVRSFGLKPGDKLVAQVIDWRIVLMKESENTIERFRGSMKGMHGSIEEIDDYIAESRGRWDREQWKEEFYDIIESDPDAKRILQKLASTPDFKLPEPDLTNIEGIDQLRMDEALDALLLHGGVRKIPAPPGIGAYQHQYRLVREFTRSQVAQR